MRSIDVALVFLEEYLFLFLSKLRLTIAPSLLDQLQSNHDHVQRNLSPEESRLDAGAVKVPTDEANFRFALNQDAMATEKLAEGIRGFVADIIKLEKIILEKLK